MKTIDVDKTLDKCEKTWKAAQQDNRFRFTVFNPVFVGEKYNGEIDDINTFNTSWEDDEIISYDIQGFDSADDQIDWNECETDSLYSDLGLSEEKLNNAGIYLTDILYDTCNIRLSDKQKKIIEEWKDEQINEYLDSLWREDAIGSDSNMKRAERAIREFAERNQYMVE